MRKIVEYASDAAVIVGCCLGVGLLSGKEAQVFFGNITNVIIFTVTFFAANLLFREYCRKKKITSAIALADDCFGRFSSVFGVGLATCCFVCVTTMLAGVNECLNTLIPIGNLPLYGVACAVISAIVLGKGMNALKIANGVSIALAVIMLIILFCTDTPKADYIAVSPAKPVIYTLFSVTMSFGVSTELGAKSNKKKNTVSSAAASIVLAAIMIAVLHLCDFSCNLPAIENVKNPFILALAAVTLLLAAVTGIVANATPIVQQIENVIPDKPLCCALIFGLSLALSMFGFDFAVKVGYFIVGVVGGITIVMATVNLIRSNSRRTNGVLPR